MSEKAPADKQGIGDFLRITGQGFTRCLADLGCKAPAIRAHSIQNARTLDLLVTDGHVVAPTRRLTKGAALAMTLGKVGRNAASTFTGLCSAHDATLFAPLDTQEFDRANPEHLFLLGYRAALRETHATIGAAAQIQMGYKQRVADGRDPGDAPSPMGLLAVQRMMVAHETWMMQATLEAARQAGAFDALVHDVIEIETERPTIATCALFSLDSHPTGDATTRVCLNVLPISSTATVGVLSYLPAEAPAARAALDRILASSGHQQRYELSRRILNSCENFVLSPSYVESWPTEKRSTVEDYYVRTLLQDDFSFESEHLCMF